MCFLVMCIEEVEYYCESCGQFTKEISNITALQICEKCASGEIDINEGTILFV